MLIELKLTYLSIFNEIYFSFLAIEMKDTTDINIPVPIPKYKGE